MGLFNRLRGRADEEQLELQMSTWGGLPRWTEVMGLARQEASSAIRRKGGGAPDYMQVMSRLRTSWESARRTKGFRGKHPQAVLQFLASEAVGVERPRGAAPAPAGDAWQQMYTSFRPAEAARIRVRQEAGAPARPRSGGVMPEGPAKYRRFLTLYAPIIQEAAREAGLNVRQANSVAWAAYKSTEPTAGAVPTVIRSAILGGRSQEIPTMAKKSSSKSSPALKAAYKRQFAGKASASDKKLIAAARGGKASSKKRASGSKCTPSGRIAKPPKVVYRRQFSGKATAKDKRWIADYAAQQRTGSAAPAASRKSSTKRSSKKGSAKAASAKGKPTKAEWTSFRTGKASASVKSKIVAYMASKRKAGSKKAGSKKAGSKKAGSKKAGSKKAGSRKGSRKSGKGAPVMAVRPAASAKAAAASVVKAISGGKAPAHSKKMKLGAFVKNPTYKAAVMKGYGSRKGVNFGKAASIGKAAFDRAPQGQKTEAITLAVREAAKAGLLGRSAPALPSPVRKSSPKRSPAKKSGKKSPRRSAGSQSFSVRGSVTVSPS